MENRMHVKLIGYLWGLWVKWGCTKGWRVRKWVSLIRRKLDNLWILRVASKQKQKTSMKVIMHSCQLMSVEVLVFVSWRIYHFDNMLIEPFCIRMERNYQSIFWTLVHTEKQKKKSIDVEIRMSEGCLVNKCSRLTKYHLCVSWYNQFKRCFFSSQVTSQLCLVSRGSKASWECSSRLKVRAWWATQQELRCKV